MTIIGMAYFNAITIIRRNFLLKKTMKIIIYEHPWIDTL